MTNGTNGDGWPYTPGSTPPSDEMKDLAARMAADEANEGNYAAAAELQAVAERTGPPFAGETSIPANIDLSPLDEMLKRQPNVTDPRHFRLTKPVEQFFGLGEHDPIHEDETASGSAERDLRRERVDTLMRLADLVDGHMLPYKLVNVVEQACEVPAEELERATDGRESDADAARRFAGQCLELQKRVEELEANERARTFVEKSLDRLKPQLARRIATVIAPETEGMKAGAVILNPERETELVAARERAEAAARRLVDEGLRFMPADAEIELAAEHLRFIVACTKDQSFLQEWDGALCDRADDPELRGDLEDVRERLDSFGQRLSGGAIEPENWGVFGLVRVPDETVFGTEADRG